jgi:hypothetical protein
MVVDVLSTKIGFVSGVCDMVLSSGKPETIGVHY